MNLLIHNATIFTNNPGNIILRDHAVATEGSRIVAVGPEPDLLEKYGHFTHIDGQGRLLMPGLVNIHMHFY
ncbi:MAG: chlorohydrolase, partial [Calditrichia bacterium]